MQDELFRKSALQTLSSPEQLDQMLKITRPRAWIALSAIGAMLAATLAWSIFGTLPTRVTGQGIIMRYGGIFDIVAFGNGVITELGDFKIGEVIHKGQRLGRIAQPELELAIKAAEDDLGRLRSEEKEAVTRVRTELSLQDNSFELQQSAQQHIIQAKQALLAALKKSGPPSKEMLKQKIDRVESEIETAEKWLQKLTLERMQAADRQNERLHALRLAIIQSEQTLKARQLQHRIAAEITSPYEGTIVEMMAMQGDAVKNGQTIASIEFNQRILQAMIYLPPASYAKLLRPGMTAQISPADAKKERYGYLLGKVSAVSKYPATEAGMMSWLSNQALVRQLSGNGAPIAVLVEFIPDHSTLSGYQWSSEAGKTMQVTSGTACSGSFIVENIHPISLVIPLLRETTGI